MRAIETTATVQKSGLLKLANPIKANVNDKVKVIVLYEDEENEQEWLLAIANNPAFDFLKNKGEDIYTLKDGKPLKQK